MTHQYATPLRDRPRFLILDFLRILAACAVVAYHYTARHHTQWGASPTDTFPFLSQFTAYGFLGVPLFFIISGFVIFLSAEGRTVGQFVSARVARLFPAYWVAVLATGFLVMVVAPQLGKDVAVSELIMNFTMVQSGFGAPHVDGAYWTLWVELLFYIMIALLMARKLTESKVYWFVFLWPLVGGIAQQLPDANILSVVLVPKYASLFAAGMILYLIHSRGHNLLRWLLFAFNACIAIFQVVHYELLGTAQRVTGLELSGVLGVALLIGIFGVVTLVTVTPLKYRGWKWMTYAGALTYPLYLVHEYWGWWVISLVNPIGGKWVALFAAFAFSFAAAMVIERWVERPLRPRIRRGLQRSFDALHTAPDRSAAHASPSAATRAGAHAVSPTAAPAATPRGSAQVFDLSTQEIAVISDMRGGKA